MSSEASQSFRKPAVVATMVGLVGNAFLCLLKLTAGFWTSSLSLLGDGLNSLTDAVSSLAILIAVNVSQKEADEGHPFGHRRAEPIAGLVVAIFAGIAGFEILKAAFLRLFNPETVKIQSLWPFVVLIVSLLVKSAMSAFFYRIGRKMNSPAILAGALDSRVDIFISLGALFGIAGVVAGFPILDPVVGLIISLFIFRSGYRIGRENIDYLMGRSPSPGMLKEIAEVAEKIEGVERIDSLRAHYVGNYIHVELEISADGNLTTLASHDLEEAVCETVEAIQWVDKAFIHVNPFSAAQPDSAI